MDFHAAIKWLADAKWMCSCTCHKALQEGILPSLLHQCCGKEIEPTPGRIVPFAVLRVPCSDALHHEADEDWRAVCELDQPQDCKEHDHSYCPRCKNRRWVPERDVEKACWRVEEWGQSNDIGQKHDFTNYKMYWLSLGKPLKEAVLRAAVAWVEKP